MELAGDKLMIILQVLTAATKKIYVSIIWEQELFNELVPAIYDEDKAKIWCKTYKKTYGFNHISTKSSSSKTETSLLDAPDSNCIECISHLYS